MTERTVQSENCDEYKNSNNVFCLETLHQHCMNEILDKLSFKELLNLRLVSTALNVVICEYLSKIRIFFVTLASCWEAPHHKAKRKEIVTMRESVSLNYLDKNFDDFYFQHYIYHRDANISVFERFDIRKMLTVRDPKLIPSFIDFFVKHMTNITEFALIIDYRRYNSYLPQILKPLFNLEVLYINHTFLKDYWVAESKFYESQLPAKGIPEIERIISIEVPQAIMNMKRLQVLYYYPRNSPYIEEHIDQPQSNGFNEHFLKTMLRRCRILHSSLFDCSLGDECFPNIKELGFISFSETNNSILTVDNFPNLTKCLSLRPFLPDLKPQWTKIQINVGSRSFDCLKFLYIAEEVLFISGETMKKLNSLPNLEHLACSKIQVEPDTVCEQSLHNKTIKNIDLNVKWMDDMEYEHEYPERLLLDFFVDWLAFFRCLKTVKVERLHHEADCSGVIHPIIDIQSIIHPCSDRETVCFHRENQIRVILSIKRNW